MSTSKQTDWNCFKTEYVEWLEKQNPELIPFRTAKYRLNSLIVVSVTPQNYNIHILNVALFRLYEFITDTYPAQGTIVAQSLIDRLLKYERNDS